MKYLALIAAVLAFCTSPVNAASVTRSVPPDSFLDYHVGTQAQLTFEVAHDPAVRARLAYHFHLTPAAMSAYVRHNLVLKLLSTPLRTRDYCWPPSGHEFYIVLTMPKGTPVFVQRGTGKPILRLVCGNPLVAALPLMPKAAAASAHAAKAHIAAHAAHLAPPVQATPPAAITDNVVTPSLPMTSAAIAGTGPGEILFTEGSGDTLLGSLSGLASVLGGLGGILTSLPSSAGTRSADLPSHQRPGILPEFAPMPLMLSPITSTPPTVLPLMTPPITPMPTPEASPALSLCLGGATLGIWGWIGSQRKRRLG